VQQPPANPTVTPTLGNVDTGGGLWFPVASGQAPAGSTVRVSNGSGAAVTLTVGPAGTWTTSQLDGFPAGPGTVTVTISTPSGATVTQSGSFTVNTPALSLTGGNAQFTMTVAGVANGRYQTYADGSTGWGDVLTDSSGTVTRTTTWYASPGAHTVSVRATSGARTGPMVSGTVTITR
jgi:hypothetical protein